MRPSIFYLPFVAAFICAFSSTAVVLMIAQDEGTIGAKQVFLDYKLMVKKDANFSKRFAMPEVISKTRSFVKHNENVDSVRWLADESFISCSIDGELMIWDALDMSKRPSPKKIVEAGVGLYSMNVTPDKRNILTGASTSKDNLWLWHIDDEEPSHKFNGHSAPVYCCGSNPDGTHVLSGDKAGRVCYHDMNVPESLCDFEGHGGVVFSQDFMIGSAVACTAAADGQVKLWDTRTPSGVACKGIIPDAEVSGAVYQALFRGDKEIVSCGDDFCIKRFDIRRPKMGPIANFFGHTSPVKSIALSPDNRFLVSSTEDGSLRIWLADELGMVETRIGDNSKSVGRLQVEMEDMQEKIIEGNANVSELKSLAAQLQQTQEDTRFLQAVKQERMVGSCVQARACLHGHKLPVATCVWQTISGESRARILSGSQDQTVCLFEVDTEAIGKLELWSEFSLCS